MNEHYALDPAAAQSARDLKVLLNLFGLQSGRFIAKYPTHWPKLFMQFAQSLPEVERARMLALWRSKKSLLQPLTQVPFEETSPWPNNAAIAQERHRAFHDVIGANGNRFGWRSLEDVLYEDGRELPDGRGDHVPMRASDYAKCVAPLFWVSAEVTLVDPYFTVQQETGRPDSRRIPVLKSFLELAARTPTMERLRLVLERRQIERTVGSLSVLTQLLEKIKNETAASHISISAEVLERTRLATVAISSALRVGCNSTKASKRKKAPATMCTGYLRRTQSDR